jgi:hypothetical protein
MKAVDSEYFRTVFILGTQSNLVPDDWLFHIDTACGPPIVGLA